MPRSILREAVPIEVIQRGLRVLGILSLTDSGWVDESGFSRENAIAWMNELRPYYYPCMARLYLDREELTYKHYLTIMRHCLKGIGRVLQRREKCMKIGEGTYKYFPQYRLVPGEIPQEGVVVEFT